MAHPDVMTVLEVVVVLEMTVVLPEIVVEQCCGRQVIPHSFWIERSWC